MNQLVGLRTLIPVVSNRSYAEPDALVRRCVREFVRVWPNLTKTTISGVHFIEADSPDESDQEQPRASGIFDFVSLASMMWTWPRDQGAQHFVVRNRLLAALVSSV
jgi:hypothetical protein